MFRITARFAEALVLRAVPGFVSLWILLQLAQIFPATVYGEFSTYFATSSFVSTLLYGVLTQSLVSEYNNHDSEGGSALFQGLLISSIVIIFLAVILVGLFAHFAGLISFAWPFYVGTFGVYSSVQEILRVKLKIRFYGVASLLQSVLAVILVYYLCPITPTPSFAIAVIGFSYALAAIFAYIFCGFPRPRFAGFQALSPLLSSGISMSLGGVAEQSLFLGVRYFTLAFGAGAELGRFSFGLDLAQRFVGFFVNVASFVFVPAAFAVKDNLQGFFRILTRGASFAVLCSFFGYFIVIVAHFSALVPSLNGELFSIIGFTLVSIAVIVNRVKKMAMDSLALKVGRTPDIAIGYAGAGCATIAVGLLAGYRIGVFFPEFLYICGYLLAAGITSWRLIRSVKMACMEDGF